MAGLKNKNTWSNKKRLGELGNDNMDNARIGRIAISIHFQETGTMVGKGHAMVVVRPGSLRETTQVLEMCLEAGVAIVPQGAGKIVSSNTSRLMVWLWYGSRLMTWPFGWCFYRFWSTTWKGFLVNLHVCCLGTLGACFFKLRCQNSSHWWIRPKTLWSTHGGD